MAAIDFPDNPTLGQEFVAANRAVYVWDGEKWQTKEGLTSGPVLTFLGGKHHVGPTPPQVPVVGDFWTDPPNSTYYWDGTAWVPTDTGARALALLNFALT